MASAAMYKTVTVLLELALLLGWTNGHGRLLEPPGRSSMWRLGYNTPPNYNDNALYCGGFSMQYEQNGGLCGICGDPYQGPRENEAGGRYATGRITRKYRQGQVIDVTVQVTANHLGWFEFKLCPNNNPQRAATPRCLNRHVLQLADGSGSRLHIGSAVGKIKVKVRLPADVTCSQCVFQWRWHTGNSYGHDPRTGRSCIGCGNQEEFYGCSDVQITPTSPLLPRPDHLSSPSQGLGSGTPSPGSGSASRLPAGGAFPGSLQAGSVSHSAVTPSPQPVTGLAPGSSLSPLQGFSGQPHHNGMNAVPGGNQNQGVLNGNTGLNQNGPNQHHNNAGTGMGGGSSTQPQTGLGLNQNGYGITPSGYRPGYGASGLHKGGSGLRQGDEEGIISGVSEVKVALGQAVSGSGRNTRSRSDTGSSAVSSVPWRL